MELRRYSWGKRDRSCLTRKSSRQPLCQTIGSSCFVWKNNAHRWPLQLLNFTGRELLLTRILMLQLHAAQTQWPSLLWPSSRRIHSRWHSSRLSSKSQSKHPHQIITRLNNSNSHSRSNNLPYHNRCFLAQTRVLAGLFTVLALYRLAWLYNTKALRAPSLIWGTLRPHRSIV